MTDWESMGLYTAFLQMKSGDSKSPLGQYTKTNENHCSLDQVQKLKRFMGILAPNVVLLDADEEPHSSNLLKLIQGENIPCLVTQRKGGRGIHVLVIDNDELFTKCGVKISLACGIVVDIKIGGKKNGLECLKWNGVEREIIYNVTPYQQSPKDFMPLSINIDFASMGEGDGRNQTLFNYILTLQDNDFSIEEIRHCIRMINKYVLKTPVSDSELETILRDEAFRKKSFFKGRVFLHDRFAEHIKRIHHVNKINGNLHFYKDGVYIHDLKGLERLMYQEISNLKDAQRKEVLKQLDIICDTVIQSDLSNIAFKNGILNIVSGELLPFSPDIVITNRIPWNYNPNAYDELMDKTLNKISCNDAEIRTLIEEMVGACFYRSNTIGGGKAFILTGEKENGKSTFLEILKTLFGDDNITNLDLKEIDDRFKKVMLFGKLVNIGDDIADEYKADTSTFKKIVTGNSITGEYKGMDSFTFEPYVKLIFSTNEIPHMKDNTGAVQQRLLIIPFNAKFLESDEDYDPQIKFKLQQQSSIEYLIRLGIDGLNRVLTNKRFSKSVKVTASLDEYERENNPVKAFVDEFGIDAIKNEPTDDIYLAYDAFCSKSGFKGVFNKTNFSKQLKTHFGLTTKSATVKGKSIRVYVQSDT